jgi:hypothetical protein
VAYIIVEKFETFVFISRPTDPTLGFKENMIFRTKIHWILNYELNNNKSFIKTTLNSSELIKDILN